MIALTRRDAAGIDDFIFDRIGIPRSVLVERAGMAAARKCLEGAGAGCGADVFAGKGMNGADARVCARELHARGIRVRLWDVFPEDGRQDDLVWISRSCEALGIPSGPADAFRGEEGTGSLIVDGIFGTSFDLTRKPDDAVLRVFDEIRKARGRGARVVSIDIPSGVDCDTGEAAEYAVTADETVTFIACKAGIAGYPGRKHAGTVTIDRLGMPEGLEELSGACTSGMHVITMRDAAALLPERPADGHKGTFGRAGILGGSAGMAGAVCLCSMSCMRAGAGLVYLIVPPDITDMCLMKVPEALVYEDLDRFPVSPDVLVAGPGMANGEANTSTVFRAVSTARQLVLDAGALNILSADPAGARDAMRARAQSGLPLPVITPHPGEMDRLLPEHAGSPRIRKAQAAAAAYSCVAVLKGAGTVVALPDGSAWINTTGNSSMAKGGSGDVLAGIIGAMLGQGLAPAEAAVFSVYFHGLCGDLASGKTGGYSAVPTDLIARIPEAFERIMEIRTGRPGRQERDPAAMDCCGQAGMEGWSTADE